MEEGLTLNNYVNLLRRIEIYPSQIQHREIERIFNEILKYFPKQKRNVENSKKAIKSKYNYYIIINSNNSFHYDPFFDKKLIVNKSKTIPALSFEQFIYSLVLLCLLIYSRGPYKNKIGYTEPKERMNAFLLDLKRGYRLVFHTNLVVDKRKSLKSRIEENELIYHKNFVDALANDNKLESLDDYMDEKEEELNRTINDESRIYYILYNIIL